MNLRPLNDHLIIKLIKKDKTSSGIVLPEDSQDKGRAEVMAVGLGRILDNGKTLEMSVKEGDKIIFREYAGDKIKENGEEFLVISESDVVAIINE